MNPYFHRRSHAQPHFRYEAPSEATSAHAGWLTRAQVAAELGYRSIYPIRKMEGTKLHPVRQARGWVFDPAEVTELKTARLAGARPPATPLPEGRLAARVFYMFDHGRELREIVEELEVPPGIVRDLWHEWMIDLEDGEAERTSRPKKNAGGGVRNGICASWSARASVNRRTSRP